MDQLVLECFEETNTISSYKASMFKIDGIVVLPPNIEVIDEEAFSYDDDIFFVFGPNVKKIHKQAFYNCKRLEKAIFPLVTEIAE